MSDSTIYCLKCGGALRRENRPVDYTCNNQTITVDQSGLYCQQCAEALLEPADLAGHSGSVVPATRRQ